MDWCNGLWAGLAFESAGEIGIGVSKNTGLMISIADLEKTPRKVRWMTFQQNCATVGIGLGGALGAAFVIGTNGHVPMDFDGACSSFDFSLDMGEAGLGKYIRSAPELVEMAAIAHKFDRKLFAVAEGLKRYEENAYKIRDATEGLLKNGKSLLETHSGDAAIISLPLPGSLGLRGSIKMKFETTDIISWNTFSVVA